MIPGPVPRGPQSCAHGERTVHAPGRINLIGEHIDYHGLSVLPMAVDRGVRLRFVPNDEARIRLRSTLTGCADLDLPLEADPIPGPAGDWGNYVRAAMRVAVQCYGADRGIDGVIESDLPPAAGLSSSSALVVALTLALLEAAGRSPHELDALELAQQLASGERFVGTEGGGMDQAASLLGQRGHALRIDFGPLRVQPIAWPEDWRVVVAHSGVHAEKSGAARDAYNRRRKAGVEAARRIARALGYDADTEAAGWPHLLAAHSTETLEDVALSLWGRGAERGPGDGAASPRLPWIRHVAREAGRVGAAIDALKRRSSMEFGRLLNESHASLRDDYQVSHPMLDRLVVAANDAGAWGARLTGAGFGGCMIAVCCAEAVEAVTRALRQTLAAARHPELVFEAHPGAGARVEPADHGSSPQP